MPLIRGETLQDETAIRNVHVTAFGRDNEARLVDRLRADGLIVTSLVAVVDARIVGNVVFSELPVITSAGSVHAVSLAPMAVLPDCQRSGIGTLLVNEGLRICRARGKAGVTVLGHPPYYHRFGFSPELVKNLSGPYSGEAWMALELVEGALEGVAGTVKYPDAFSLVVD